MHVFEKFFVNKKLLSDIKSQHGHQVLFIFTMSDFLSWDSDIDLDKLLGDYTEYESDPCESDNFSDDFQCTVAKKPKSEQKQKLTAETNHYKCPHCDKTLKTIAGFRGHTTKQHGVNLKANDHKVLQVSSDKPKPKNKVESLSNYDFAEIFYPALEKTLANIETDLFVPKGVNLKDLCVLARADSKIQTFLSDIFSLIFNSTTCNLTTGADREQLFRSLHRHRVDNSIQDKMVSLVPSCDPRTVKLFLQLMFEDIVGEILYQQTKLLTETSDKEQSALSTNDQTILYYIAGYIVNVLLKRYAKHCSKKLSCVSNFTLSSESQGFVKVYDKWYNIQNRGGLKKPCDAMFLLVRELEVIVRKCTGSQLNA